jgi:nickel-dependent lactate racemase
MTLIAREGPGLSDDEVDLLFSEALNRALREVGGSRGGRLIIIPPDITRFHSRAGFLTDLACRELGGRGRFDNRGWTLGGILPALGTHAALGPAELGRMFPGSPRDKFLVHDWRQGVETLGRLEPEWVEAATGVRYDWPVQVNRLLPSGDFSLILSIGQVVPHEVAGMANHGKNILVGTGGKEAIDKSHFAGALYGLERIMGRTDTPVRALFDEGLRRYGDRLPPILWVLTVVSGGEAPVLRGLFAGFGRDCFERAAALSRQVNLELLDRPLRKVVAYLDAGEFRSTWLGNKAIYRTRMALADGGELLILAPALEGFGEDPGLDAVIRRYGYRSGEAVREMAAREGALGENLSVAAHLIHGSPEGRFTVRYCPGPGLGRPDLEAVGYQWGDLKEALARYDPRALRPGRNLLPDGEEVFFIPNPALGLWAEKTRFEAGSV